MHSVSAIQDLSGHIRFLLPLIAFISISGLPGNQVRAQADTEFWFVAPAINQVAGEEPLVLMLASMDDAAEITLRLPADPDFTPLTFSLAAQEIRIVDLSPYRFQLENGPPDMVRNKGIFITATAPITTYYRVAHPENTEIFQIRGREALGKEFYIPGQNEWLNGFGRTAFHILASEPQTIVEITPSQAAVGHSAGLPFSILLDRGETFAVQEAGINANQHLAGSYVRADKPISITFVDQSLINNGATADLTGDQLIPLRYIGMEYIVMRGEGGIERAYILATSDSTAVSLEGGPPVWIDKGQILQADVDEVGLYLTSNLPVYVWHLSGNGNEAGGALIAPITCSGARKVKYIRPGSDNFFAYLLTRSGNEDGFLLNGANNILAADFVPVPGTSGDWLINRIEVFPSFVTSTNEITNSKGVFHMGFLIEFAESSAYGYLTDFSSLTLGEQRILCRNDSLLLDAGPYKSRYLWSTGDTSRTLTVRSPGTYWVEAEFDGCMVRDTTEVIDAQAALDIGTDTLLCEGDALLISLDPTGQYVWEDGTTDPVRILDSTGTYSVIQTQDGCTTRDSIVLSITNLPLLDLGPDTLLCDDESIILDAEYPGAGYQWNNGSRFPQVAVSTPGIYWVERTIDGCPQRDTLLAGLRELLIQLGEDTLLCRGDTLFYAFPQDGTSYLWDNGSISPKRQLTEPALLTLTASNRCELQFLLQQVDFEDCSCTPFLPNVFSPNSDGVNDQFLPELDCPLISYELQVFDRWGKPVYQSLNPADGWDGEVRNKAASPGVYYWTLEYEGQKDLNRGRQVRNGNVLLVR